MKQFALSLLYILLGTWSLTSTAADEGGDQSWTFNLYFENDLFAETDRDYTNGIRLAWVSPDLQDYVDDARLPNWLRSVNKRLTFFHGATEGIQRNLVFSLGQTIYTPQEVERSDLITEDRPYAGWLYSSFAYHTKSARQLDTLALQLGIVGPSAHGETAQDFIHDIRGFDKFQGWDNQLEDEPGLLALYEHKRKRVHHVPADGRFGYDVITHAGGALGNVGTYLNLGIELRLGWRIPDDFGTSAVRPGGDNSTPDSVWDPRLLPGKTWGIHFFASLDSRLVLRDIFLDGNTFKDSHSVDKEPLVSDLAVGVSAIFRGMKISFARVLRSKEFKGQEKHHAYGSFSISLVY